MSTKQTIKGIIEFTGYRISRVPPAPRSERVPTTKDSRAIPDARFYDPRFLPWSHGGYGDFARYLELATPYSLIAPESLFILYSLCRQAMRIEGEVWECGVYKGGSAKMLTELLNGHRVLRLFDTFEGMPETDPRLDWHKKNDFADSSLESVRNVVGTSPGVEFRKGFIPQTFTGLENSLVAFAHIDVDIYRSVKDCAEFIIPRMTPGGIVLFDDYGHATCPGARKAVDEVCTTMQYVPLILATGQAVIFKNS